MDKLKKLMAPLIEKVAAPRKKSKERKQKAG
jgi:hypothetical protein